MKKRTIFFTALTLAVMITMGQTTSDTVGTGSGSVTTSVLPGFYGYHLSACLYTASELGIPSGTSLRSLSYHLTYGNTFYWNGQRVKIRLLEPPSAAIPLNQSWDSLSAGATVVYDSTSFDLQWDDYWKEFLFSQAYTYQGGNLIVLVEGYGCSLSTGDCETEMYVNNGTNANCWIRVKDGAPFNFATSMSGIPEGTHGNHADRPDIFFTYDTTATPPTPSCMVTLPYTQDFENLTVWQDYPTCWGQLDYYGGLPYTLPGISPQGFQNSDGCLFFAIQSPASIYAVTPLVDTMVAMQNVTLSFYYKSRETNSIALVVGVMTNPLDTSTFSPISTIHANATQTWEYKEVNLAPYSGGGHYIAFRMDSQTSSYVFPSCFVDNVTIALSASCAPPAQIQVSVANDTLGTAEATFSWVNTPNATGVRLFYKESSDSVYQYVDITGDSSYTLGNLSSGTLYDYYLMSLCGGDSSNSSQPDFFATPCESINSFPWSDGFENGLICWTLDGSVANEYWDIVSNGTHPAATPQSGSNMARFYAYGFLENHWATIASPAIDMSQELQLTFQFHQYGEMYSYTSDPYADRIEVYLNHTPDIDSNATLLVTQQGFASSAGWVPVQVVIPAQSQPYNHIIFKGISDFGYNLFLDDITLDYPAPLHNDDTVVYIEASICEGESYDFHGTLLSTSGNYVDTLSRVSGSDSVVSLTLTVYPTYEIHITDTIQEGEAYNQYGFHATAAGHYQQQLVSINGCDSIIHLELTVLTGISERPGHISLHIFPNPAQEEFTIEGIPAHNEVAVRIFDNNGILLRQWVAHPDGGALSIRRQGLASGLYLIMLRSDLWTGSVKILLQ